MVEEKMGREEEGNDQVEGVEEVMRVLVVDDSPVDRRMVERLLNRSGNMIQVIAVDSGRKAMEVLGMAEGNSETKTNNDQRIDVILSDYCMPEMTGYDLLKAIKEHTCPKPIPVVIMSSEDEPQRISSCRAIGAEDFIIKPLQPKDIQRLRKFASPAPQTPKTGTKRKLPLDMINENNGSERRPRFTGLAVA